MEISVNNVRRITAHRVHYDGGTWIKLTFSTLSPFDGARDYTITLFDHGEAVWAFNEDPLPVPVEEVV